MVEYNVKCLVVVIAVFLPSISDSIDQDFTNPVSQNIPLENIGLAALNKLVEAAELEDKINETATEKSGILQLINVTSVVDTTEKNQVITKKDISNPAKECLTNCKEIQELVGEPAIVHDEIPEPVKADEGVLKDQDHAQASAKDSIDASKVVEKRETDFIERNHESNSSALQPSDEPLNKSYVNIPQQDLSNNQCSSVSQSVGRADDLDNSRRFRDVYDENGNIHNTEEKLQPEQNSLFSNKNPTSVVVKTKNRCSLCEDRMQKVVPDGSSFIELGCDHEEDDTIRKFQDMLTLIDNIIESAGSARKELGLCRKSKLADAACLLTNDDEKLEKTVLQIVSCVKDAMKDMSSKNCIPLPRELHSFLIWLLHGSEGGGMVPPTVQESKSKPSYLFHEDNHRPHLGGSIYGTPPCPSGSLIDLISAKKAMPVQPSNNLALSPQNQEQESVMNLQPQYELESNPNSNINNQYIAEQKNDLAYQRKLPFIGRNYYRPLRSVYSGKNTDIDNQASSLKSPIESFSSDENESDESCCQKDDEYERLLRKAEESPNNYLQAQSDTEPETNEKSITKRDLTRKKTMYKKSRDEPLDNLPRKKKRREGVTKLKKSAREQSSELKLPAETSNDVQNKLQRTSLKGNNVSSKCRKDKRKDKKKFKGPNQKETENYVNANNKETNGYNRDLKKEESNTNNENSSDAKSLNDEPSFIEDPMDLELESVTSHNSKSINNKQKKKHKNSRKGLNKDKKLKATEAPSEFEAVNMNLSELIPNMDSVNKSSNKKNRNLNQDKTSARNFQVSFSNKVRKSNKSKPSIVFEDDLSNDSNADEDEDYSESEYDLNDSEEYEQNYDDENEDADIYYDQRDSKISKIKNKSINPTELKKKSRETLFKTKPTFLETKKNRIEKKKKKPNTKANEKSLTSSEQFSATVKTESSQSKTGTTELLLNAATESQSNIDFESAPESVTHSNQENVDLEINGEGQNKPEKSGNEVSVQEKKEMSEEPVKSTLEGKDNSQDQVEQGLTKDDTRDNKKPDKEEKSDSNSIEDSQGLSRNSVVNPLMKTGVHYTQENQKGVCSSVKSKLSSKEVSKFKHQNTYINKRKRKPVAKKKITKPVSKVQKDKPLPRINNARSELGSSIKKSQGGLNIKVVSKTRHKATNDEEDDSDDEGIQSDLSDKEESDDESDVGSEDDDALDEIKPKTQMWADDDRSLLDPYSLLNIEVAPNSDIVDNNFLPKPVRRNEGRSYHVITNKNPPFSKESFLQIINSPELQMQTRNFAKERQDKLINVTQLLKGVEMIGESQEVTTATKEEALQDRDGLSAGTGKGKSEAKESDLSDTAPLRLTTIATKISEETGIRPTYRTTPAQPTPRTVQPRLNAETKAVVSLDEKPTNLSTAELDSEFHCFPLDRVSLTKSFGDNMLK